jgi:hypothetical protein
MATYIYETVPESPEEQVQRFEVKQSMKDDPLVRDPATGKKVRRIISGGIGIMAGARPLTSRPAGSAAPVSKCRSGRCGCC